MGLVNAWILIPLGLLVAGVIAVALFLRARRSSDARVPVAHTDRLTRLGAFRAALARTRIVTVGIVALFGVVVASTLLLAARPVTTSVDDSAADTRDIVLCLDVSGSMIDVDIDVLDRFEELSKGFKGERLALVVFNSSAAQVFPLTDDYAYIADQLTEVRESLDGTTYSAAAFAGTLTGEGASLIGDGLASCILTFDGTDTERSRSVVLATDNDINGVPIMTLDEAGTFAAGKNVRVYGIDPSVSAPGQSQNSTEFQRVADTTKGGYFVLSSVDAVPQIIDSIEQTEAALLESEPQLIVSDKPVVPALVALVALGAALILVRRARL